MMNLPPKYVATFTLGFAVMIGWNVFLAQRDTQLFRANPTPSTEVRN